MFGAVPARSAEARAAQVLARVEKAHTRAPADSLVDKR
jgi:hypothetical protein